MLTIQCVDAQGQSFTISVALTATAAEQTGAIQGALDQMAARGGGTVSLSAGTWTLAGTGKAADGCLRVGSNTTLEGAGQGETVLKLADGSSSVTGIVRTDSGKTLPDGTFATVSNVTVRNLTIDGNKAGTSGEVDGFYSGPKPDTAQADTNITLDAVEIMNCSRYGFDPHERTVGLTIANSSSHHNGLDGYTIDFCAGVTLTNNVAFANGRHGFNLVTGTTGVVMTGNVAYANAGSGIVAQTGDNEIRSWTGDITITGGALYGNGRAGIEARQVADIAVDGVDVSDNAMDGIILSGVHGATVAGVTFGGNGGTGNVRVDNHLQDFNDTDAANDRWIGSTGIVVDGVARIAPALAADAVVWSWTITDGNDTIEGSSGRDVVAAGSGDDIVNGGSGDDVIYGNDGADTLDGGAGHDRLVGGAGADRLYYSSGVDVLDGGTGSDTADFSRALGAVRIDMTVTGFEVTMGTSAIADLVSIEHVKGTSYGDEIIGNASKNTLDGGSGNDVLFGGGGDDTLLGGGGNDWLAGGLGNDVLTGGAGSDVFVFERASGVDRVSDFARKQDKIAVVGATSMADLSLVQVGGDTHISFAGDTLILSGVRAANLAASDFQFV